MARNMTNQHVYERRHRKWALEQGRKRMDAWIFQAERADDLAEMAIKAERRAAALEAENGRLRRTIDIYTPALELLKTECNGIAKRALRESAALAPQSGEREESQPTEIALCEIEHICLHPDQLYVFRKVPGCVACEAYLDPKGKWNATAHRDQTEAFAKPQSGDAGAQGREESR